LGNSDVGIRTGAVSKSSLRRQISLSKIDKNNQDRHSDEGIDELMEDTFVREPLNIEGSNTAIIAER